MNVCLVKLIDDEFMEWRWPIALVVPRVVLWRAHQAVAIRIWRIGAMFTGVWIALETLTSLTHHPEPVGTAVADAGNKAGPGFVRVPNQQIFFPG